MSKQKQLDARIHSFLETKFQAHPDAEQQGMRILEEVRGF